MTTACDVPQTTVGEPTVGNEQYARCVALSATRGTTMPLETLSRVVLVTAGHASEILQLSMHV